MFCIYWAVLENLGRFVVTLQKLSLDCLIICEMIYLQLLVCFRSSKELPDNTYNPHTACTDAHTCIHNIKRKLQM